MGSRGNEVEKFKAPRPWGLLPKGKGQPVCVHLQPSWEVGKKEGGGGRNAEVTRGQRCERKQVFKKHDYTTLQNSWQQHPEFKYSSVTVSKMMQL